MAPPLHRTLLALALIGCGTALPGEGGGVIDDPMSLSGAWLVSRTLVISPAAEPDFPLQVLYPVGFRTQDTWVFTVTGQRAMVSVDGSTAEGTFAQGQWTFSYQLDAGSGVRDDATLTVTSTAPRLRGTMSHRYTTRASQRVWLEVWTLEGTRQ